jgi:hypothetical protein
MGRYSGAAKPAFRRIRQTWYIFFRFESAFSRGLAYIVRYPGAEKKSFRELSKKKKYNFSVTYPVTWTLQAFLIS